MKKYKKIIEIMNKINSSMNFQSLLTIIIDSAKDLINVDAASYLVLDEQELIFDVVISDKGEIIKGKHLLIGEGAAGHVAQTKKPIIINDVTNSSIFCNLIDQTSGYQTRNLIAVPVMIKDKMIGVLEAVNSLNESGFTDADITILMYLADAAAVAINNHELLIDLKNRVNELTCIYEISQSIYFTFDIREFLSKILFAVNKVINAKRCSFLILSDDQQSILHFVSTTNETYDIDLENSLMAHVIKTGDPLLVYNVNDDSVGMSKRMTSHTYSTDSFICVPMKLRDKIIGVLNVTDKSYGDKFDSFDLRVLSTVANNVAETYENISHEKERTDREILENELQIAAELQKRSLSVVPAIEGISMGAFSIPAHIVGGDFFEITIFDDNTFSCAVGDVSGKGIHAAIFMNSIRNALRFEAVRHKKPETLFAKISKWVYNESYKGMFCTFVYCLIEKNNSLISYASAGHNNQLFFNNSTNEFEELKAKGKPFGIIDNNQFEIISRHYQQGDFLILFTDGLIEEGADSNFTRQGISRYIRENKNKSARELTDELKLKITEATKKTPIWDDSTLLIVKFE